jgi:uncharacterized membrane protein
MRSRFAIFGHPIHPMLVSIPIGLFVWAFVCDIVYIARDHETMWYDIAFWSGIAAWVTALVAALPGFGDYFTMARHSSAAAMATAHMTLNLVIVALYVVATVLMLDRNAVSGGQLGAVFILHLVGSALLLLSGWLGGEMVFRHHLAMVPDDDALEREERVRHDVPASGTARHAGQNR